MQCRVRGSRCTMQDHATTVWQILQDTPGHPEMNNRNTLLLTMLLQSPEELSRYLEVKIALACNASGDAALPQVSCCAIVVPLIVVPAIGSAIVIPIMRHVQNPGACPTSTVTAT